MTLTVNDEKHNLQGAPNLEALLAELGVDERKGLAVAVNACVVPAGAWARFRLNEGDAVLLLRATQGG